MDSRLDHDAGELAGVSHHTVARYVQARGCLLRAPVDQGAGGPGRVGWRAGHRLHPGGEPTTIGWLHQVHRHPAALSVAVSACGRPDPECAGGGRAVGSEVAADRLAAGDQRGRRHPAAEELRSPQGDRTPGLRDPERVGTSWVARRGSRRVAAGRHRLASGWSHGPGKGNREDQLPLPHDVGDAIVGWLQRGRPPGAGQAVFTRVLAPHRALSARGVSGVVREACRRAGLPPVGSHRLRHTVATETLRAGGSLAEVGQLLRQNSAAVSSIYAKVDRLALSAVVQPWPGGAA